MHRETMPVVPAPTTPMAAVSRNLTPKKLMGKD